MVSKGGKKEKRTRENIRVKARFQKPQVTQPWSVLLCPAGPEALDILLVVIYYMC